MSEQQFFQSGYQQALDDFGIKQLISKLKTYSNSEFNAGLMHLEEQELESLAAILIEQLTQALNGKLIASYLHAIGHGNKDVFNGPINLEFSQTLDLPSSFPNSAIPPRFLYGDKLRLVPLGNETETGVVIGRFYNYATHRCRWMWCYIWWLSQGSFSAEWLVATTVWEEDLEAEVGEV
jgi:hypothetical protein